MYIVCMISFLSLELSWIVQLIVHYIHYLFILQIKLVNIIWLSKVGRSNSKKNTSNNLKRQKINLIYSTIFEKILNQQISNGIDDKPHVVSISNASQMAIGLWPRFFLFFEFSRYILYTWMVILWTSIVRKGNCDGCSFNLFLKNNKKNRSFFLYIN